MPRLKGNTKEIIMEKSLRLFAERGFDAVSVRTIAEAVGIGNSALYKHFPSKQAIFDAIVETSKGKYLDQCCQVTARIRGLDEMKRYCLEMFEYQTGNEWIVMFRKLLLHEKFHDEKMAEIYKMFFVDIPINNQMAVFDTLQKQGLMIAGDTRVYAMELYAPFYLYHFVENDKETLSELYEKHVEYFFDTHFLKEINK